MKKNKDLFLVLKTKWYRMIESGEKKEEYRDINQYWFSRLTEDAFYDADFPEINNDGFATNITTECHENCREKNDKTCKKIKYFDNVIFQLGYSKKERMSFKINDITIGEGKEEWGYQQ